MFAGERSVLMTLGHAMTRLPPTRCRSESGCPFLWPRVAPSATLGKKKTPLRPGRGLLRDRRLLTAPPPGEKWQNAVRTSRRAGFEDVGPQASKRDGSGAIFNTERSWARLTSRLHYLDS